MRPYFRFGLIGGIEDRSKGFGQIVGKESFGFLGSLTRDFVLYPSSSISFDSIGRDSPRQRLDVFVDRNYHEESTGADNEEVGRIAFREGDA